MSRLDEKVIKKFSFISIPTLDVELLTMENKHLYISRGDAEYKFDSWYRHSSFRGNTNIMVSGRAGTGKTTFIDYFFQLMVEEANYIRIDMRQFFEGDNRFNEKTFFTHVYNKLDHYLTRQGREQRPVGRDSVAREPEYFLSLLLQRRFTDERLDPLFLFIDNIDVRPTTMHEKSLNCCQALLSQPNIRVVFASRRRFSDYIRHEISGDFYGWFDIIIDMKPISYRSVVSRRLESVSDSDFSFPFEPDTVNFIQNYSNDNLRTALRYTKTIMEWVADKDCFLPIEYDRAVCALYLNNDIPRIYSLSYQTDDRDPIFLKVLHFLRLYHRVSHKYYSKLHRICGYSRGRLDAVCKTLIAWRCFDKEYAGIIDGEHCETYLTTARVGELFHIIDCGLLYQLHLFYDVPKLHDPKSAFIGYEKNPWGSEFEEPIRIYRNEAKKK
jgi:hypothetical protein